MKFYKHKQINIIGELREDGFLHFEESTGKYKNLVIPRELVEESVDWEEFSAQKELCFSKIMSVQREDGVTFTIGDTIKVNNEKATFNHIITGFVNHIIGCSCFTCITTKDPNKYGDELINIDIIKKIKNTGFMTKQCLCIQDYVDVLNEQNKAFLFLPTMIKYLKEKI